MSSNSVQPHLRALTCAEVRDVDVRAVRDFGLPSIVLMENAGRNCAELLLQLGVSGPVVICAGKGNNGGDGFVMARHLRNHGVDVRLLLFASPAGLKGDAATNYHVLQASDWQGERFETVPDDSSIATHFASAQWIVDALLGTGSQGELREPFKAVVSRINQFDKKVFAVDLPTGLDADSGVPGSVCLRADHTATFVASKIGFANPLAKSVIGQLHVIDIGIPSVMLDPNFKSHTPY